MKFVVAGGGVAGLADRIETILGRLAARSPSPPGPPREELLARLAATERKPS
jgi:hypothetical protein